MDKDTNNADIYTEGAPIFLDSIPVDTEEAPKEEVKTETKEETPAESQPETKTEENVPFHEHPRWKKMQKERETLASELEETKRKIEELSSIVPKEEEKITVPKWWVDQYGDTELSFQQYKQYLTNNEEFKANLKEELKRELEAEKQANEERLRTAKEQADAYVEESLQALRDEGKEFDNNELFKFMLDFEKEYNIPIVYTDGDLKGSYNFAKAYELMTKLNPKEKSDITVKKKEIASETMNARPSRESAVPIINRQSLRNGDWRDQLKTN